MPASRLRRAISALPLILVVTLDASDASAAARGWLGWRGPEQSGASRETRLPGTQAAFAKPLWTYDLPGRGTAVFADGRLFVEGWKGDGPDLQEMLVALDAETGKLIWEHGENDFLSDTIYYRYAIGAPAIDPQTGNVYAMTANGVFTAYDRDGKILWQHSMMEEFGRMTFPNSRTGAPIIDDDLVIVRGITSNWGAQGPPRDRLYAFDKITGAHVWGTTPGDAPKDNSFATPVLGWFDGQRVLWTGLGCGNVAAVNARTGQPLWRYPAAAGGVNSSPLLIGDQLIVVHGVENVDASDSGRMIAIDLTRTKGVKGPSPAEPAILDKSIESWRNDLSAFSSSPVYDGKRIYLTDEQGQLNAVDPKTGNLLWRKKLARDQVHASPLFADGKLYVPMNDCSFHVLEPSEKGAKELAKVQLEGACLGAPSAWNGKIYVQTTTKLYAFGKAGNNPGLPAELPPENRPPAGVPTQLQARPSELILKPGDRVTVTAHKLDAAGLDVGDAGAVTWQKWIPPSAKVKSFLDADFDLKGEIAVPATAKVSAGAFEGTTAGQPALKGHIRGRLMPGIPISEDFESVPITEDHPTEKGIRFGWPPLPWIGGRFAWEVRVDPTNTANRVLAKTMDLMIRQRAQSFIGTPDMKDYTIEADVLSDGNKRLMSDVGLIDQRYRLVLKGTWQHLEIASNDERIRSEVPFKWEPNTWYHLKERVDTAPDGSTVVRGKAWKRGEPEPEKWLIEVPHKRGHQHGSPGIVGFVPQNKFRVYVDNIKVTPNAEGHADAQ